MPRAYLPFCLNEILGEEEMSGKELTIMNYRLKKNGQNSILLSNMLALIHQNNSQTCCIIVENHYPYLAMETVKMSGP